MESTRSESPIPPKPVLVTQAKRKESQVIKVRGFSRIAHPRTIVVTGAGGAGKTRLANCWATKQRKYPEPTVQSIHLQDVTLVIRRRRFLSRGVLGRIVLTTIPGQVPSRDRQRAFQQRLGEGRTADGAIHVVPWGFNQMWPEGFDPRIVRQLGGIDDPVEQLREVREHNLNQELLDLKTTLDWLEASWQRNEDDGVRRWIVVAVAKCDLFWSNVAEALSYYSPDSDSRFGRQLAAFSYAVGGIDIEVMPISTRPEVWQAHRQLRCTRDPELGARDAAILMREFYGRLEQRCGVR